jgi:hypothetical protein
MKPRPGRLLRGERNAAGDELLASRQRVIGAVEA